MKLWVVFVVLFSTIVLAAPPDETLTPRVGDEKKSAPKSKSTQQSLTGCLDEQDGSYVLLDDRMLNKLANLEAVGVSNESYFARHLGHKVTVKGSKSSEPDAKFRVTSIEDLSAVCAPAQPDPQ